MIFPVLDGLKLHKVLIRTVTEFVDDEMPTYASALAYQMLFSLFPFLLFLIALIGFLHLPDFFTWLRLQSELVLPPQALEQVNPVIDQLQQSKGGLLGRYRHRAVDRLCGRTFDDERDERRVRRGRRPADLEAFSAVDFLHRRHCRHVAGRRCADGAWPAGHGMAGRADRHAGVRRHPVDHPALAIDRDPADVRRGTHVLRDAGRRAEIPLHYPRLGVGRGGVDYWLPWALVITSKPSPTTTPCMAASARSLSCSCTSIFPPPCYCWVRR